MTLKTHSVTLNVVVDRNLSSPPVQIHARSTCFVHDTPRREQGPFD